MISFVLPTLQISKCTYITKKIIRLFHISYLKNSAKPKFEMNTAYFRHVNGENVFHVTFRYVNKEIGIDKQFNFCRSITEKCSSFLNRIDANIEKVVEKKKKSKAKKNEDVQHVANKVNAVLLRQETPIHSDVECSDIFLDSTDYALDILNCRLVVEINAPWVEALALPKGIMAGFLVYPSKFESYFEDKNASVWTWYRSVSKIGPWQKCGEGALYHTVIADVGHYLRVVCVPYNSEGRSGPAVEAVSPNVVEAGPGPLPCDERHKFTEHKVDSTGLRVVSYNMLADLYVKTEYSKVLFGYCPEYAQELPYRRQLLVKELLGYNADIYCLQEVDSKVFRHDLQTVLASKGIIGEFSKKGDKVNEGTAIFYDSDKMRFVKSWRVVLSEILQNDPLFVDLWAQIRTQEALAARVTGRSTTLQVLLLECLTKPERMILLGNVHLYFHPDADHVRLLQGIIITSYLEHLLKYTKNQYPEREVSLIWCGDFNSVPECGIYQLLTTGSITSDYPDWRSNEAEAAKDITYSHPLKLASACGTPSYTNYTAGFKACLDYIFYDTETLEVEQIVPLPSEEDLSQHLAIPSIVFPSDHLSLVSDLRWKNR